MDVIWLKCIFIFSSYEKQSIKCGAPSRSLSYQIVGCWKPDDRWKKKFAICHLSELRCAALSGYPVKSASWQWTVADHIIIFMIWTNLEWCACVMTGFIRFEVIQVTPHRRRLKTQKCPRVCQSAWVIFNLWPCKHSRAVPSALTFNPISAPNQDATLLLNGHLSSFKHFYKGDQKWR